MNYESFRKVLALFEHCRDKAMPKQSNYLLIRYCQCVHVEKMERRVIYVEEHNINARNLTDCADIKISYNAADGLLATAINDGNQTDSDDDSECALIDAINAGNLTDCADITISDDVEDEGGVTSDSIITNVTNHLDDLELYDIDR